MNKKIFASLAISVFILSPVAFADSESALVKDLNQQFTEQITQDELLASTEGYMLEQTVRPKSRRSALFAHILDTMAKGATMAKLDKVSVTLES